MGGYILMKWNVWQITPTRVYMKVARPIGRQLANILTGLATI